MNNNTEQNYDEEEDDLWDAVMKYRRDHPEKNLIADTGKMVEAPDFDQNLLPEVIAKINEWAEITAELIRQNAELRQSCILYHTEREELKKQIEKLKSK